VGLPTCERCGSNDLRRKRPRLLLDRLYRLVSGRHRYACNACHHRGWTSGRLPHGAGVHGVPAPPGRPLEHRDHLAERQARLDRTIGVVVALVLGALLAGFIAWAVGS
jgi:hypothetical protein